jgi:hypothetical protein
MVGSGGDGLMARTGGEPDGDIREERAEGVVADVDVRGAVEV